MSLRNQLVAAGAATLLLLTPKTWAVDNSAERQSLEEVRNTVVNLLQALVDKGLLSREQAQQLVKQAQDKAVADAAAATAKEAATAKAEENAIRVPYVPQTVKDEISKQVAQEVKPAVVADVVKEAKEERWGIPGALPEWLSRVKVFGDVAIRAQTDRYPGNNYPLFLDFNAINQAGGYLRAAFPYLDSTKDRNRLRLRARFGVEAALAPGLRAYIRLSSGSLTDPGSENQTLGTYAQRYSIGIDQAYITWDSAPAGRLPINTLSGGRMGNPWFAPTELIYARDLAFEGVTDTVRLGWGAGGSDRSHVYATLGGFPILEVPFVNKDNKWLVGGQIGTNLRFADGADHLRAAVAYYDFLHVTGVINDPAVPGATNYTAPAFVRYGNTMFDIANNLSDSTQNLFALASHFRLVDISASYELGIGRRSLTLTGDAVRNIGYKRADVERLNGAPQPSAENKGYVGEVSFGDPLVDKFAKWRLAVGYRYVKSDAVIDAWTDSDFHGGGTNARGYYAWGQFGLAQNTWLRVRYMSANEIDSLPFGVDTLQIDVNARF